MQNQYMSNMKKKEDGMKNDKLLIEQFLKKTGLYDQFIKEQKELQKQIMAVRQQKFDPAGQDSHEPGKVMMEKENVKSKEDKQPGPADNKTDQ